MLLIFSENVPNDSGPRLTGAAWFPVPPVRNVFLMLKLNLQALYKQPDVTLNTREEEIRRPASQIGWLGFGLDNSLMGSLRSTQTVIHKRALRHYTVHCVTSNK